MSQAFFAPNNSITGGAAIVSFNSKEANTYIKIAKQVNNNPDKKNFDMSTAFNIKFSADETAGMVRAIRTGGEFKFFHQVGDYPATSGNLGFYSIDQQNGKPPRTGFGLKVKKDGQEYKVGFTEDTAERLKLYLEFALGHMFTADYSEDKAKYAEYLKNKEVANGGGDNEQPPAPRKATATKPAQAPAPRKQTVAKSAPAPAPEPDPVDDAPAQDNSAPQEDSDLF